MHIECRLDKLFEPTTTALILMELGVTRLSLNRLLASSGKDERASHYRLAPVTRRLVIGAYPSSSH